MWSMIRPITSTVDGAETIILINVAGTGTIVEFVRVIQHLAVGRFLVVLRFEIYSMAQSTVMAQVVMIKSHMAPGIGAVTLFALIMSTGVVTRFALSLLAVMAGFATAEYSQMVHPINRYPGSTAMTVVTGVVGGNMG